MIEILVFLVAGVLIMEFFKIGKGFIIYTVPSRALLRFIERASYSFPWRALGEAGIVLLVGPFLARDFVKSFRSYWLYFVALFFLVKDLYSGVFYIVLGVMGLGIGLLGQYGLFIVQGYISGTQPSPGVGLLIPGVEIGPFRVPLVEGVIALIVALLVHEGAHGCVALQNRVPVSNAGIITVGVLPIGAFVEPSETVLERKERKSKAEIFAAGPSANILVYVFVVSLLFILAPFTHGFLCSAGEGVRIMEVPEKISAGSKEIPSSAHGILFPGDIIKEVNGKEIKCVDEFVEVMSNYREENYGGKINVEIERNGIIHNFSLQLREGFMGIKGVETVYEKPLIPGAVSFVLSVLQWIALVNMLIGIVNALPLPVLDGGLLANVLKTNKKRERMFLVLMYITLLFLAVNVLPWFL